MLAILERMVRDLGGTYLLTDTDSMYCLFKVEGNTLLVRKPSGHGLEFFTGTLHNCRLAAKDGTEMERRFAAMDL